MSDIPPHSSSIDASISSSPATFQARNHTATAATRSWTQVVRGHPSKSNAATAESPTTQVQTVPAGDPMSVPSDESVTPQDAHPDDPPNDGRFRAHVITVAPPLIDGADPNEGITDYDNYLDAYWGGDIKATPRAVNLTVDEMVYQNSGILNGKMKILNRGPGVPNVCIAYTHIFHRPRINEPEEADTAERRRREGTPCNQHTRDQEAPRMRELRGGRICGTGINRRPVVFETMAYESLGPHLRYNWRTKEIRELDPSRSPIPGGIYVLTRSLRRREDFDSDETVLDLILPILDPAIDGSESLAYKRAHFEDHPGLEPHAALPGSLDQPAASIINIPSPTPGSPHSSVAPTSPCPTGLLTGAPDKGKAREMAPPAARSSSPRASQTRGAQRPLSVAIRALRFHKVPRASTAGPSSSEPAKISDISLDAQPSAKKRARTDDPYAEIHVDYDMSFEQPNCDSPLHPPFVLTPRRSPSASQDRGHSATPSRALSFQPGQAAETVNEDFGDELDYLDDTNEEDVAAQLTPRP